MEDSKNLENEGGSCGKWDGRLRSRIASNEWEFTGNPDVEVTVSRKLGRQGSSGRKSLDDFVKDCQGFLKVIAPSRFFSRLQEWLNALDAANSYILRRSYALSVAVDKPIIQSVSRKSLGSLILEFSSVHNMFEPYGPKVKCCCSASNC